MRATYIVICFLLLSTELVSCGLLNIRLHTWTCKSPNSSDMQPRYMRDAQPAMAQQ